MEVVIVRSSHRAAAVGIAAGALLGGSIGVALPVSAAAAAVPTQHVIALLRDQHPDAPAGITTLALRQGLVARDQAPLRQRVAALGGTTTHAFQALNALALSLSPTGVAALQADPAVSVVVPDLDRSAPASALRAAQSGAVAAATAVPGACPADPAKPQLEPEALQLTHTASDDPNALTARSLGYTGKGVKVAFIADGIDPNNPDFIRPDGSKVFTDYQDFSGDGPNAPSSGAEAFGDASSIAAQGRLTYDLAKHVSVAHPLPAGCTIRIEGMAPGASLVGLKIFPNALLTAPTSMIIQAIDWAVTHDHVDVINESFGANPYPDTAQDPVSVFNKNAVDAGVTVVASSGDAGIGNTAGTASTDPWVISAGASTQLRSYAQETRYGFQLSNGSWVSNQVSAISSGGISQTNRVQDLLAPGDLGWALCSSRLQPDGTPLFAGCRDDNGRPADIQNFGGTSQSAPFTAGAAALVVQAYRLGHHGSSPTPQQVRRVLDSSADDIGAPAQEQGAGLLNSYRAVQLAASLGTAHGQGQGLIADVPQISHVAAAGSTVTSEVVVRNQGRGPQTVTAQARDLSKQTGVQTQTVPVNAAGPKTFIDSAGTTRAYTTATFQVPPGVGRLDAAISYPGSPVALVRMSLLDPQGTFTGYTLPQGAGNFGQFDVQRPAPGTWTAILFTTAGSKGYTGPVTLSTTDFAATSAGAAIPASFTLAEGASQQVTVTTTAPASDASAASLVLTGRFGQTTTVPIVTRAVQQVSAATPATFSGTFRNGNGRSFAPAQTDTYLFDVPAGAKDLTVDLALSGTPANQVIAHLSDPSGEPVSTDTSYLPSPTGSTAYSGLEQVHARPVPGRYQLTVELLNPISGAALPQSYRGTVRLNGARVSATGIPSSGTTVPRRGSRTATVTVHNTGPVPQSYYVDARTSAQRAYGLVAVGPQTVALPLPSEDVPSWLVPTRTTSLTVGGSATAPVQFDVMALDNPTALNAPSSPDVEAVPSGNSATAVHTADEVTSSLWGAFPSLTGPTSGTQTGSITMSAQIVTQGFARDWTGSAGDPLLATVDRSAPTAHPVAVAPGGTATLTVTLSPSAAVGATARGTLFVNTISPYGPAGLAGLGDEVAALPYAYTVG